MNKRYIMWAGMGIPEWLTAVLDGKKAKPEEPAIWPIIDDETCGEIQGEPSPDQFFCVAFTSATQRIICNALNASQPAVETDAVKCQKCKDSGEIEYYHDAGDHFGAGIAPDSEWKTKPCECQKIRSTA